MDSSVCSLGGARQCDVNFHTPLISTLGVTYDLMTGRSFTERDEGEGPV